jgi:hypothetical protein
MLRLKVVTERSMQGDQSVIIDANGYLEALLPVVIPVELKFLLNRVKQTAGYDALEAAVNNQPVN